MREVETYASRTDIVRQVEFVFRVFGQDDLVFLVFAHESAADGDAGLTFGERFDDAVEVQLSINAAHQSVAPFPIVALLTEDTFEGESVYGTHSQFETEDGVVHSEIAVLVGAQYHSVAELLVEGAGGY